MKQLDIFTLMERQIPTADLPKYIGEKLRLIEDGKEKTVMLMDAQERFGMMYVEVKAREGIAFHQWWKLEDMSPLWIRKAEEE